MKKAIYSPVAVLVLLAAGSYSGSAAIKGKE